MDRKEIKTKIMKGLTIALPILLVAVLAMLIVVAMNLSEENSVPVFNDGGIQSSSSTKNPNNTPNEPNNNGNGENPNDPAEPDDDPTEE